MHSDSGVSPPRLLVTGGESPAGLAALRALEDAGFETWAALLDGRSLGGLSRSIAGKVIIPDPRTSPDAFVRSLANAAKRLGAAAVLPGSEAALIAIAGRTSAFPEEVALGVPIETTVQRAMDKAALATLSVRAGLDVPPSCVVARQKQPRLNGFSFPAMVKPLRSELLRNGQLQRFEARWVRTAAELDLALRALPNQMGIVQPYIVGRLVSVNGVAFDGQVYGVNQHIVHRVWPDRSGHACYAETVSMTPGRERAVAHIMRDLGWNGIFNLQLIERDGHDFVIDLNPRFYVSLTLAAAAGLNLPAIWASLLLGLPIDAHGYRAGVRFREERGDPRAIFAHLRRGQHVDVRDLGPRRGTVHAVFSIRDPAPSLTLLTEVATAVRDRIRNRARAFPRPMPRSASNE